MSDLATFALAFAVVWIGLALYLVRLHLLARRLEARLKGR
jgi:CcmD family protein